LVVPETNTVAQPECEALRPDGVTNHVARMSASKRHTLTTDMDGYAKSLQPSLDGLSAAIAALLPCEPSAILIGHSINSFWGGVAGARSMAEALAGRSGGVPVLLPSLALLAGLQAVAPHARRLALLTPYFPPGDELVASFFVDAGYEICDTVGLRCKHPLDIASRDANQVRDALSRLVESAPDAIVQPGTNLPTARLSAAAEREWGLPILACNPTAYWYTLRHLGIRDAVAGFGRLLETC
jgi:maleate isomerase